MEKFLKLSPEQLTALIDVSHDRYVEPEIAKSLLRRRWVQVEETRSCGYRLSGVGWNVWGGVKDSVVAPTVASLDETGKGGPRKHATNAERQAAYRARKKGGG